MIFKRPSIKSGVYLLLSEDGAVVYIGMSKNMCGRVLQHAANGIIDFDGCITLPVPEMYMSSLESFLINNIKPLNNKAMVEVRDDSEIRFQYVVGLVKRAIFGDDTDCVFRESSKFSGISPIVDGMYMVFDNKTIANINGSVHIGPAQFGERATLVDDFDHDKCAELALTPLNCNSGTISVVSRFDHPIHLAAHLAHTGRLASSLLHFEIDALLGLRDMVVDFKNEYEAINLLANMLTESLKTIGLIEISVDSKYSVISLK